MKGSVLLVVVALAGAGTAMGQSEWTDHPDNPVIDFDEAGSWASEGLWVNAALFDGTNYHAWFTGIGDHHVFTGIGHATSPDGIHWTMDPANPVIVRGSDGEWDDGYALGGAVILDDIGFHMWYTGGGADGEKIGYATSPDGSVWTKHQENPVMEHGPQGSWDSVVLGVGAVIVVDDTYRMWFYGATENLLTDGKIGYAESSDGISWDKNPLPVLEPNTYPGSWEVSFLTPTVVFDGDTYHMWYSGNSPTEWAMVGYAYSTDGLEWTQHRGNPVHAFPGEDIDPVVFHDGSTFQMLYTRIGLPISRGRIASASSDCCPGVTALDHWQYIPAAAVASGAQGTFYQTDVDISNADDVPVEYRFLWLPRGEDNSEPAASATFSLEAGMSARYANVLTEVFGLQPSSFGALAITASSPDLLAMSRTYNLGNGGAGGTYGQAMPALSTDEFIQYGETRRILFGSENAGMRTNVGCQNASGSGTMVALDLYGSDGTSLGREMMILRALGNDQINRIFAGHNPMTGYVDVTPAQADRPVYCYGSVLDNTTSDPTTIPPQ
jgi:predicted GH43/DUF377 family glycosyl hydrolase